MSSVIPLWVEVPTVIVGEVVEYGVSSLLVDRARDDKAAACDGQDLGKNHRYYSFSDHKSHLWFDECALAKVAEQIVVGPFSVP